MQSKYKSLAGDTLIFGLGNLLMKVIQLILMPVLTIALTTEQYGSAELLNNATELAYPIICLCLHDALFRFAITKEDDEGALFSSAFAVVCITFPILCICALIGYHYFGYQNAFWFALIVISMSLRQIAAQFSRGIGMRKEFAVSGVLDAAVLLVLTCIFLLVFKLGPVAYLASLAISHLVSTLYIVFVGRLWRYLSAKSINTRCIKRMLVYSLPMIPNCSAIWFINLFNRYAVLGICGASAAGLYTAAAKFPSMMNMISTIFQQAWQIFASRGIGDSEIEKTKSFSVVFAVYSTLLLTLTSIAVSCSSFLALVLLQGEFYIAWKFIPGLLVGAMLSCYSIYFGTLYNAAMKNRMLFISTAVGALVNVVLTLILVPYLNAWGAVFTPAISYAVVLVIRIIDTRKIAPIKVDMPLHILSIVAIISECTLLSTGFKWGVPVSLSIMIGQLMYVGVRYLPYIKDIFNHSK